MINRKNTENTTIISSLYGILRKLNLQKHLYSIRTAYISIMPIMIIGAYAVVINNLPISSYQVFMEGFFGPHWQDFGALAFNSTIQIAHW